MNIVPGRYRLNTVELSSELYGNDGRIDVISGIIGEVNIFENIFSDSITGNVVVSDSENLPSTFPIVGHEKILIDMVNPDIEEDTNEGHIKSEYKIYSITQQSKDAEGVISYLLNFQSEEIFTNLKSSVSKAYSGSTISNYVRAIYDEYIDSDKEIDIEPTKNNYNFVIPNWKPFKTINWMAQRAIGEDKNGANYLFFENRNGFVFASLEKFYEGDIKENYYYERVANEDVMGIGLPDGNKFITNYKINTSFDILENIPIGMYASRMVVHDITKRQVYNVDYNYSKRFDTYENVESWSGGKILWEDVLDVSVHDSQETNTLVHDTIDEYTTSPKSFQRIITKHSALHDGLENDYMERTVQNRISQMEQLNNFILEFFVPGDFRRNIGDVIYINIPSIEVVSQEDKLYSGRYIIIALRHRIDGERHSMIVVAAKDSYFTPIPA